MRTHFTCHIANYITPEQCALCYIKRISVCFFLFSTANQIYILSDLINWIFAVVVRFFEFNDCYCSKWLSV